MPAKESQAHSVETLPLGNRIQDGLTAFLQSRTRSMLLLLLLAVVVRIGAGNVAVLNGGDEEMYGLYARLLGEQGVQGLREIIHEYPQSKALQTAPMPFRFLYVCAARLSCAVLGGYNLENLVMLSTVSWITLIALTYLLCRHWFPPEVAFAAGVLMITSPLALAISRRALQDGFFAVFVVASFLLLLRCCRSRPRVIDLVSLGACVTAGLLTKESMLVLYPAFAAVALYYRQTRTKDFSFAVVIPFLVAPVFYVLVCAWLAGSFGAFHICYNLPHEAGVVEDPNGYGYPFARSPWFRYLIDFLLLSPVTYLLSIVGMVAVQETQARREGKTVLLLFIAVVLVVFTQFGVFGVRFVAFLEPFLRVVAACGLMHVLANHKYRLSIVAASLVALAAIDLWQFHRIFIEGQVYDPLTYNLFRATGFVR